jgi:HlyD family secretion protein
MKNKHSWLWSLALILVLGAVSWGVFVATRPAELPEGFLYGNGHIEGTEVRVASEVGGRVVEQHLTEGGVVRAGEPVVVIDAQTSQDRLRAVEGELAALRESKAAVESQIEIWTHHSETARRQLDRVRDLLGSQLASQRDVDEAENGLREAQGQLQSLRAQSEALDGQIMSAEAKVDLAKSQLEKTEVDAPEDGTVMVRAVETGEVVQPGQPLALLVDLSKLELKVYVPEREIGKVELGGAARVKVDAFPERFFDARVARVDDYAQFTPRDIHVPEERTRMVYGVTLALDNPDGRLKPGMPADAWIRWDDAREWPAELPVPEG